MSTHNICFCGEKRKILCGYRLLSVAMQAMSYEKVSSEYKQTVKAQFSLHTCSLIRAFTIGIKHGFSCINIRQVLREVLKTEAGGRGFQHLPRDLGNVNALKNHVRLLLLHKNWKHLLHFTLFLALFCFTLSPMSGESNFHGLCSF